MSNVHGLNDLPQNRRPAQNQNQGSEGGFFGNNDGFQGLTV